MAIPTKYLRCLVDAKNIKSYSGTGTTWTDISGNGNNFNLSNVSFNSTGYFSFNGTTIGAIMTPSTPNNLTVDNHSTTVSVLVRATSNPGSNKAVVTDNFGPEFGIWWNGTNYTSYAYGGRGGAGTINQWMNVTMVLPYVARPPLAATVTGGSHTTGTTTLVCNNSFTYSTSGPLNDRVTIQGVNPSTYNGTFELTGQTSTSISYAQGTDPGTYVSGGIAYSKIGNYRVKQYINGVSSGNDVTGNVGNGCNDWPITLGYDNRSGAPTAYFTGDIGWFAIWQTALDESEIVDVYNTLRGRM